jgi:hypothetical protein
MLAAAGPGNRSDTVQRSLEVAERQVATLIIRVSPSEDVLVRVDGETVETTLPGRETLWHVAPGPHTITAARQGYVPGELTVNAPRGERSVAVLQLKVVAPQTVTALEKKQVPERPHAIGADESPSGGPSSGERSRELPKPTVAPSAQTASAGGPAMDATRPVAVTPSGSARATLISGAGLTVLAAGGAAFFTVRASGLADDAAAMRAQIDALHGSASTPACPATPGCAELTQKLDERNHANNAATALWVSTGVLGAATALTYFLWPSPNSKASSGRAVTIVPAPAAAGASLAVSGRF